MIPQLVLVGHPNVGKSTLFNKLAGARDALVADVPGLTRDRRYKRALLHGKPCILVDVGGLDAGGEFGDLIGRQVEIALADAWLVLFVVDAQDGLTVSDELIARDLRRHGLRVVLIVNKMDGVDAVVAAAEASRLGFVDVFWVSARRGHGMAGLTRWLGELLPAVVAVDEDASDAIRTAVVGRPNVGKSTLINQLLGEERQIVFDRPGTTRDAIDIPYEHGGTRFQLIDTAGVRRKGRVSGVVEKFSVVKALDAMERAQVVVLMLDGQEGVVDQDLHVLKLAVDAGAGLVIAVNKRDALNGAQKRACKTNLDRRLAFAPWAPMRFVSALRGDGVNSLMAEVRKVHRAGALDVSTTMLNKVLHGLVHAHPPPAVRGRPIKLRYAHKLGSHPPRIGIHGNQTQSLPASYVKYLENGFRQAFNLVGAPVRLELKTGANPYAGKPNPLTRQQQHKRQRLLRHRRGR